MPVSEYIRSRSGRGESSILAVPVGSNAAYFTFLHAGRSHWGNDDPGPANPGERGHAHHVYHALLYTSGRNTMIHDGVFRDFHAGTLVLTDPGMVHEYRPREAGGGEFIEITFDLGTVDQSPVLTWEDLLTSWSGRDIELTDNPLSVPPPHQQKLESIMNDVVSDLLSGDTFAEESAALAMGRFIIELCRFLESRSISDHDPGDRMERARNTLERRYASDITVGELAGEACLSEGAFIRAFSARFGKPPMTYRKILRITAAQHLLSVSGLSIGEIASKVGYGDIYAFSRTFKAVSGMTASDWRRRQQAG